MRLLSEEERNDFINKIMRSKNHWIFESITRYKPDVVTREWLQQLDDMLLTELQEVAVIISQNKKGLPDIFNPEAMKGIRKADFTENKQFKNIAERYPLFEDAFHKIYPLIWSKWADVYRADVELLDLEIAQTRAKLTRHMNKLCDQIEFKNEQKRKL